MSADLPNANNNDNNDNNDNTAETSPMANGDNNAALDPVTPTDITLTRQQQRVLNYLARRRMRNAHITKRQTYADLMETRHNNNEPTPNPHTLPPITHETPIPDEPLPSPSELVTLDGEWVDPSDDPLWSPWNAGLTRDILKSHANNQHEAPFLLPEEDERPSALGIFSANTQPLKETPIPIPAEAPLAGPLTVRNSGILLPPLTYRPRSAKKAWRRKKVLRHIARKHMRAARVSEYRTHRRLWTMMGTIFLVLLLVFLSLGTAGSFAAYRFYYQTQNKYEHRVLSLRDLLPLDNLKMYDSKGVPLMQMTDQGLHTTVLLDEVAPIAINASIATEDKNFWTNQGIDILRILRAAIDNLRSGQVVEGGSTITQQLIKNLVVGNKTTFERKLEEVVLTPQINSLYTKHDILEMYLNSIYYGHQAYGIDAAATIYFGLEDKPGKRAAMQMDLAQAAMIAGIPSNPSAYDPLDHPKAAFQRFENVLGLMMSQQYITKVEALDAIKEAQSPHFFKTAPSLTDRAPHFANFVLDQLVQQFGLKNRSQLSRSGMIVYTTLDISLQDKIQKIAQKHIAELRAAHHLTNAAEVLIDFHTGAILSLLGSIDYNNTAINGQFDVATQGYRQPGSSFKPYVYVTAFKQGASPAQAIDDAPTTIDNAGGDPPFYSPTNYDLSYHGHMTLRCALQNSLNVPAVRVLKHVGIGASMQTAKEMGITSYQGTPGYSLVLGGLGIRLIDHTSAMGTFANGGVHVGYYAINKVVSGTSRKVIYQRQLNPGKRVISPQLAYMMTNVLSDNTARIP